jgi:hypothetical protein
VEIGFKDRGVASFATDRHRYNKDNRRKYSMELHLRTGIDARHKVAEDVARQAAALALDYYNKRETLVIETKRDPQDVVSIADREVEQLIRGRSTKPSRGRRSRRGIWARAWNLRIYLGCRSDRRDEPVRQRHAKLVRLDRPPL